MRKIPVIIGRSQGFLLFEVMIALAFMAIIAFWQMNSAITTFQESIGKISGGQLKTIGDALGAYATANAGAVINNSAVTGVATTRAPTVAELVNLGFLSPASGSSNINGGTYVLSLSKNPAACVQPNCNISGYALLNKPLQINGRFSPAMTGEALKAMGSDGGASTLNGATIQGTGNSWSMANPLAGQPQGTIAYQVGSQSIVLSQAVRRDGTTPMTGSLNLGGNSVFNLTTAVAGAACSTAGALAQTTTGSSLYCDGTTSTYKAMGGGGGIKSQPAVATYAALPLVGNNSGDLRRVTGLGNQAFIWDGSAWQGTVLDSSGNTVITGTATIETLAGNLTISSTATSGAACSPNGRVAQDGSGLILSCQSGAWVPTYKVPGASLLFTVNQTWWLPASIPSYCNGCGNWQVGSFYTDSSGSLFINTATINQCCSLQTTTINSVLVCTKAQMTGGTCTTHTIYSGVNGNIGVYSANVIGNTLTFNGWGQTVWGYSGAINWSGVGT